MLVLISSCKASPQNLKFIDDEILVFFSPLRSRTYWCVACVRKLQRMEGTALEAKKWRLQAAERLLACYRRSFGAGRWGRTSEADGEATGKVQVWHNWAHTARGLPRAGSRGDHEGHARDGRTRSVERCVDASMWSDVRVVR